MAVYILFLVSSQIFNSKLYRDIAELLTVLYAVQTSNYFAHPAVLG
jgi:hypothetical protein